MNQVDPAKFEVSRRADWLPVADGAASAVQPDVFEDACHALRANDDERCLFVRRVGIKGILI